MTLPRVRPPAKFPDFRSVPMSERDSSVKEKKSSYKKSGAFVVGKKTAPERHEQAFTSL